MTVILIAGLGNCYADGFGFLFYRLAYLLLHSYFQWQDSALLITFIVGFKIMSTVIDKIVSILITSNEKKQLKFHYKAVTEFSTAFRCVPL